MLVALAAPTVMAFAGRFVVAGAQPGQEARCSAEGNQAAGSAPISPMTGAEPCPAIPGTDWSAPLGTKGLHHLLDLLVQRGIIELVQMGRVQPAHQGRDDR